MTMSLFASLKASPGGLPLSSKFTVLNGIFYLAAGTLLMIWPGAVQALLFAPDFVGRESALMRVLGKKSLIRLSDTGQDGF